VGPHVTLYGYARVSAAGQALAPQEAELTAAGCGQLFTEQASGKAAGKRRQLARALAALQPGDILVVTRLNRLARSARDALNLLAAVTAKGADFRSLRESWADTTTAHGRLMVTIMSGLSEFDREMILERTAEGRAHARTRGVKLGRRPSLSRQQEAFIWKSRAGDPPMTLGELQDLLGVSRSTICRAIAKAEDAAHAPPAQRDPRQIDLVEQLGGARNVAAVAAARLTESRDASAGDPGPRRDCAEAAGDAALRGLP
jgi:DNA invertase Pin-like site-specific DNA recombinase